MGITIGIVLFDGCGGARLGRTLGGLHDGAPRRRHRRHDRERTEPVRCAKGLRVLTDHTFADAPALDVVVVPGGHGSRQERSNPAMIEFLQGVEAGCTWVTSVCTGAFVLHGAGIARDQPVTTHWGAIEELRGIAADLDGARKRPVCAPRQGRDLCRRQRRYRHVAVARRPADLGRARPDDPIRHGVRPGPALRRVRIAHKGSVWASRRCLRGSMHGRYPERRHGPIPRRDQSADPARSPRCRAARSRALDRDGRTPPTPAVVAHDRRDRRGRPRGPRGLRRDGQRRVGSPVSR